MSNPAKCKYDKEKRVLSFFMKDYQVEPEFEFTMQDDAETIFQLEDWDQVFVLEIRAFCEDWRKHHAQCFVVDAEADRLELHNGSGMIYGVWPLDIPVREVINELNALGYYLAPVKIGRSG
jgi:hypothetical protein